MEIGVLVRGGRVPAAIDRLVEAPSGVKSPTARSATEFGSGISATMLTLLKARVVVAQRPSSRMRCQTPSKACVPTASQANRRRPFGSGTGRPSC